jgi:hypothetical protein
LASDRLRIRIPWQTRSWLPYFRGGSVKRSVLLALCFLTLIVLAACGGSSSTGSTPPASRQLLSKNWQLTMADQADNQGNDFSGGLSGGFLLQKGNAVTGSFAYSIVASGTQAACAGGAASVSGTLSGQNVTLTVNAGAQTFTLGGTLSADGSTMMGTYTTTSGVTSTAGTCGVAQTGAAWSAVSVPTLTGSVQGNLHPTGVYAVTGSLLQGENIGASSATLTGELFASDYPCFTHASLQGTISGSSVFLNIIGDNGLTIGQIGTPPSSVQQIPVPAVVQTGAGGAVILRGIGQADYRVTNSKCPGGSNPGDAGAICLGIGTTTGCAQPLSFSLNSIAFPSQPVGTSRSQTVTLSNTDPTGATVSQITLLRPSLIGEFNGVDNFQTTDNCGTEPFALAAGKSCTITVTFTPQQSCSKDPYTSSTSVAPLLCPSSLSGTLSTQGPTSPDDINSFGVSIRGTGMSALVPLEAQLGFSAVAPGQSTPSQKVTLVNTSSGPVTIAPSDPNTPCVKSPSSTPLPGLQAVKTALTGGTFPDNTDCHIDGSTSGPANFPITNDGCSGTTINPGKQCTFDIAFSPQADITGGSANDIGSPNDYFLQLNSLRCAGTVTSSCEIDSGRLPIQLKWNNQSPLRISPNTGFDFGPQPVGTAVVQTFTLVNDPTDPSFPNHLPVTFLSLSTSSSKGFTQTNTCGSSLASGSTCTIDVTFQPTKTGLSQDQLLIVPGDSTSGIMQVIYLWGTGQ